MGQRCPVCGNDSTVARVSGIVAGGTSHTSQSGFKVSPSFDGGELKLSPTFSETGTRGHTELSTTLAYWPEGGPTALSRLGGLVLAAFGGFFLYTAIAGPGTLHEVPWLVILVLVLALLLLCGGVALLFQGIGKQEKRRKAIWDELYYCYRDDVVYNPREGEYRPRSKMSELLSDAA